MGKQATKKATRKGTAAATPVEETTPVTLPEAVTPSAEPSPRVASLVEVTNSTEVDELVEYAGTAEKTRQDVRQKLLKASSTMLQLVTLEASRIEDEMTAEILQSIAERLDRINTLLASKSPLMLPVLRKQYGDMVAQISLLYRQSGLRRTDADAAAIEAAKALVPNFS